MTRWQRRMAIERVKPYLFQCDWVRFNRTLASGLMIIMLGLVTGPAAMAIGALSVDSGQGTAWGVSWSHATKGAASRAALAQCGANCRVVLYFWNGCGAWAADQTTGSTISGWAVRSTPAAVQVEALRQCRRAGGRSCQVRVWGCDNRFSAPGQRGRPAVDFAGNAGATADQKIADETGSPTSYGQIVAKFALSACYENVRDLSRVAHMASLGGWERLPASALEQAPANEQTEVDGWEAPLGSFRLAISVKHWPGQDGQAMNICSVYANSEPAPLLRALQADIALKKLDSRPPDTDVYLVTSSAGSNIIMELELASNRTTTAIRFIALQSAGSTDQPTNSTCKPDEGGIVVCGVDLRTLRMIKGSLSPSARFGIFWGFPTDETVDRSVEPSEDRTLSAKDIDAVENYLVRLDDGRILVTVPGKHFGDRDTYNHRVHRAVWSPDSHYVVIVNANKWQTDAANVYEIEGNDQVRGPLNIANVCRAAALAYTMTQAQLQGHAVKLDQYLTNFDASSIDNNGVIEAGCRLAKPKDDEKNFSFRFQVKYDGERLAGELLSIEPEPN
jgi:Domain of unknown function (DUF4189)